MRTTPERITKLEPGEIFVFGSNLAGRHGKGAALIAAKKFGAVRGIGIGRTGQCYAIATKDPWMNVMPLPEIADQVRVFIQVAAKHPEETFLVTQIGCGLAGYKPEQIAPMFKGAPENVVLPECFQL